MYDIRHRVGVNVPAAQVFDQLATTEGLASWWTRQVEGDASLGGKIEFYFGSPEPSAVMEVVDLQPDERVEWRCIEGPAEWIGTRVVFELATDGDETVVLFTHADWRRPVPFMHHCSTRWAYFLISLRKGLSGGAATPYPDDESISSWR